MRTSLLLILSIGLLCSCSGSGGSGSGKARPHLPLSKAQSQSLKAFSRSLARPTEAIQYWTGTIEEQSLPIAHDKPLSLLRLLAFAGEPKGPAPQDPKAREMAELLKDCQFNVVVPPKNKDGLRLGRQLISASGVECPIESHSELNTESTGNTLRAQSKMTYLAKPSHGNYWQLNEMDSAYMTGGFQIQSNQSEESVHLTGRASGLAQSRREGDVSLKSTIAMNFNQQSGAMTLLTEYSFSSFVAAGEVRAKFLPNGDTEIRYFLNSEEVSQAEYEEAFSGTSN